MLFKQLGMHLKPLLFLHLNKPGLLLSELLLQDLVRNFILGDFIKVIVMKVLVQLLVHIDIKQNRFLISFIKVVIVWVEEVPWSENSLRFLLRFNHFFL
jgi:hypothetical protein